MFTLAQLSSVFLRVHMMHNTCATELSFMFVTESVILTKLFKCMQYQIYWKIFDVTN